MSVVTRYGFNAFYYLPLLLPEQANVPELKGFIVSNLQLSTDKAPNTETYFRTLICFYDCVVCFLRVLVVMLGKEELIPRKTGRPARRSNQRWNTGGFAAESNTPLRSNDNFSTYTLASDD